ncbi:hypothetical protein N8D56_18355 [Devosia sp. A8/3-2]|nr:hypothetical protein N8D56_18355 [Devosia sp. A8/3-2]
MATCLLTASAAFAQQASFFDDFDSLSNQRWYVADGWATGTYQNCTGHPAGEGRERDAHGRFCSQPLQGPAI